MSQSKRSTSGSERVQEFAVPGVAIKEMEGFRVATVRHRGPSDEIGLAFQRLLRLLHQRRVRPIGPMIVLRRDMPRESTSAGETSAAAVPVARDVRGDAELRIEDLPPAEVASLMFEGTPTQVAEGYAILRRWIEVEGFVRAGPIREIYSRDLSELPPGIVYMEIQIPVRKKRP